MRDISISKVLLRIFRADTIKHYGRLPQVFFQTIKLFTETIMIRPLKGKILVEVLSDYKQTKSGIWLAGTQKEVYHYGRMLAVGAPPQDKKGRILSWPYEQGDIVHFKKYSFKKWQDEDFKTKVFLTREDILAYERGRLYAANDYVVVKIDYKEKIGKFYVPDNKKQYTANFTGKVVSVGPDVRLDIEAGDEIIILRMEGGGHEGFKVITDSEEYWSVKSRWIYGKEGG